MSRALVTRLKLPIVPYQLQCVSIDGNTFSISQCCYVTISVLNYTASGPCGIMDSMPADLLLGNDFLFLARCRINYATNALERNSEEGLKTTQIFSSMPITTNKSGDTVSDRSVTTPVPQPDQLSPPISDRNCPSPSQTFIETGGDPITQISKYADTSEIPSQLQNTEINEALRPHEYYVITSPPVRNNRRA